MFYKTWKSKNNISTTIDHQNSPQLHLKKEYIAYPKIKTEEKLKLR